MSIIDTIAENLPESVLDAVYALQQKRLQQIEAEGVAVTVTSLAAHPVVKTIKSGNQWFFSPSAPIKAGAIVKDGSVVSGTYVVLEIQEQAGRLSAQVLRLPDVVSFFTGESRPADFGISRVSLKATNWCGIPCHRTGNKLVLPATYTPDRGDVLLLDGAHFTAAETRQVGPIVEVELQEY